MEFQQTKIVDRLQAYRQNVVEKERQFKLEREKKRKERERKQEVQRQRDEEVLRWARDPEGWRKHQGAMEIQREVERTTQLELKWEKEWRKFEVMERKDKALNEDFQREMLPLKQRREKERQQRAKRQAQLERERKLAKQREMERQVEMDRQQKLSKEREMERQVEMKREEKLAKNRQIEIEGQKEKERPALECQKKEDIQRQEAILKDHMKYMWSLVADEKKKLLKMVEYLELQKGLDVEGWMEMQKQKERNRQMEMEKKVLQSLKDEEKSKARGDCPVTAEKQKETEEVGSNKKAKKKNKLLSFLSSLSN